MPHPNFKLINFILVLCALVAGCVQPTSTPAPLFTQDSAAYWPTNGWRTSTPEEQGMDSVLLADMMAAIQEQGYDIDSVTVIRNGYIVADVNKGFPTG
jgi:hypothetical protein